jgi:CCR4-NOT transcription complex subunit 9
MTDNVTEENRRTLGYIADLLNDDTREAALLELSKKREQVPELALILWHSFGMRMKFWDIEMMCSLF